MPDSAVDPSPDSWRATLIARTWIVMAVTAGIAQAMVIASFLPRAAPRYVWIGVALYSLGMLAMWLTRRTPRLQAVIMLAAFVLIAPFLFAAAGLTPSAFLCLTLACVLAAILVGYRASIGFFAAGLVAIGASAAWVTRQGAVPDPETLEPLAWARHGILWLAMTGWVVFATVWLTRKFEASLRAKDRALHRLRTEEQQRLEAERRHHQSAMELIEAQKREAMGRLANGIAHDFNNSLLVILGWNEMLKNGNASEEKRQQGHLAIASAAEGAAQLARHLLTIGRRQVEHRRATRLGPLVEEAARHLKHLLPDDIRVRTRLEAAPPVVVDRSQMHQVLLNLALNARDAMPRGGTLELTLRTVRGEEAGLPAGRGWVELIVSDDGSGMDEATLARMFEPYFTTKAEGHGTGLGLATTQAIVKSAGGHIRIHSEAGRGTRVTLQLPVSDAAVTDEDFAGLPVRTPVTPGIRIAVVEDDEGVRLFMTMSLRMAGHEVLEAKDGDAALALLNDPEPVEALCVDAIVPGAPIERVIEAFRRRTPGGPVLVCSGNVGSDRVRELIEQGELTLLAKPFTGSQLVAKLGELTGGKSVREPI